MIQCYWKSVFTPVTNINGCRPGQRTAEETGTRSGAEAMSHRVLRREKTWKKAFGITRGRGNHLFPPPTVRGEVGEFLSTSAARGKSRLRGGRRRAGGGEGGGDPLPTGGPTSPEEGESDPEVVKFTATAAATTSAPAAA